MNESILNHLKALVDSAVAPVNVSEVVRQRMREELLAHLTTVFEQEMVSLGDEPAALAQATTRFGDPAKLSRQLQESVPAGWFNHNRLYNTMLVVFCFYVAGGMTLLASVLAIPPESRPDLQWPDWSLPIYAVINGVYLLAMIATLALRLQWPEAGKRLTKVVSLLFLLGLPLGTALGIYGLWWVDQDSQVGATT